MNENRFQPSLCIQIPCSWHALSLNQWHGGLFQIGGLPLIIIGPNFSLCHCLVLYLSCSVCIQIPRFSHAQAGSLLLIIIKHNFSLGHCLVLYLSLRMDKFQSTGSHMDCFRRDRRNWQNRGIHKTGPQHGPQWDTAFRICIIFNFISSSYTFRNWRDKTKKAILIWENNHSIASKPGLNETCETLLQNLNHWYV